MKRILLILSLLSIVCSSCWKTEEIEGTETLTGIKIYKTWRSATESVLNEPVRYAFICNAWANGNDSVRRAVEDAYLPYLRLRDEGNNEYGYYDGTNLIMTVNTGGKNLDEADAQWLVTVYGGYRKYNEPAPAFITSTDHSRLTIKYLGTNQWNVALDSVTCKESTSDWTLTVPGTEVPTDVCATRYTLEGTGQYRNFPYSVNGAVTISYTISEPVRHHSTTFYTVFDAGTVDMTATKPEWKDLNVKAEILDTAQVRITYRGVSKTWENYMYD